MMIPNLYFDANISEYQRAKEEFEGGADKVTLNITRKATKEERDAGAGNIVTDEKEITKLNKSMQTQLRRLNTYNKYKDLLDSDTFLEVPPQSVLDKYVALDRGNSKSTLNLDEMKGWREQRIRAHIKEHLGKREIVKGSLEVNPEFLNSKGNARKTFRNWLYRFKAEVGKQTQVNVYSSYHVEQREVEKHNRIQSLDKLMPSLSKSFMNRLTPSSINADTKKFIAYQNKTRLAGWKQRQANAKKQGVAFTENQPRKLAVNDKNKDMVRQSKIVLGLLMRSGLRPGSRTAAESDTSYGITSLRKKHVSISGNSLTLNFVGKDGVNNTSVINNVPKGYLAAIKEYHGKRANDDDFLFDINESTANNYLQSHDLRNKRDKTNTGGSIVVKDLRTHSVNKKLVNKMRDIGNKIEDKQEREDIIQQVVAKIARDHNHSIGANLASYANRALINRFIEEGFPEDEIWQNFAKMLNDVMMMKQEAQKRGTVVEYDFTEDDEISEMYSSYLQSTILA